MTCGGGGASVVRGGVATFRYVMFENNRAPRGGGVCVHDATAVYGGRNDGDDGALGNAPPPVAFRGNAAAHPWIGQTSPAIDVVRSPGPISVHSTPTASRGARSPRAARPRSTSA